jgi:N-acetylmuramoyl-L-alanine amidase
MKADLFLSIHADSADTPMRMAPPSIPCPIVAAARRPSIWPRRKSRRYGQWRVAGQHQQFGFAILVDLSQRHSAEMSTNLAD